MATKLRNMKIHEISLVDRPANKSAKVVLAKREDENPEIWWDFEELEKREFSAEERRSAASSGAALPDGSFPIKNSSDLHNAMQAIGRAKDPARAKAHIRARAKALGLTGELSDAFKSYSLVDLDDFILKTGPAGSAGNAESTGNNMLDAMIKALGLPAEATEEDIAKAMGELKAKIAEKDAEIAKNAKEAEAGKEEVEKAFSEKLAKAEKRIADLEEKETVVKFDKIAGKYAIDGVDGTMIRKAHNGDGETIAKFLEMIASAHAAVEEAGTFREIGTAKGATSDKAIDELNVLATELQKKEPGLTFAQAFTKVYQDPAHGKLVAKERDQNRPQ